MRPVYLNLPLVLEAAQSVSDGAGGIAESWAILGTLWAEIVPGSGREIEAADELVGAAVGFRITVRGAPIGAPSRPGPGQRFRGEGRVFRILTVTERDANGRYLVCTAREEVPA
jgi:SPP1 family predicted phage head-tail adaptor